MTTRDAATRVRICGALSAPSANASKAIPAVIATCAPDGMPNVSYLSQLQYVDSEHVALSYQFFNKTRQNVLDNPRATLLVVHPVSAARYRRALQYLRTETSGPLFENMKARSAL